MARPNRRKQKRKIDSSIGTGEMRLRRGSLAEMRSTAFDERPALVTVRCRGRRVLAVLRARADEDYRPLVERFDLGSETVGKRGTPSETRGAWSGRVLRDGQVSIGGPADGFGGAGKPVEAHLHVRNGKEGVLVACPVHGEHVLDPVRLQRLADLAERRIQAAGDTPVGDVLLG